MASQAVANELYFEDFEVGDTFVSPGRTITETDIVNFACLTGDFNPLHMDHEFAANTPFGKPIAHGLLGLSYMAGIGSSSPIVKTAAFVGIRNWKFARPIFAGDTIRVETEVAEKQQSGRRRGRVIWKRRVLNQHDEVVQEGELETLVMCSFTRPLQPR